MFHRKKNKEPVGGSISFLWYEQHWAPAMRLFGAHSFVQSGTRPHNLFLVTKKNPKENKHLSIKKLTLALFRTFPPY